MRETPEARQLFDSGGPAAFNALVVSACINALRMLGEGIVRRQHVLVAALVGILLSGCVANGVERPKTTQLNGGELDALMADLPSRNLNDPFIAKGIDGLREGDYVAASRGFNRALKFDPTNANLHFLNALSYHLRADTGDSSQYDLAKAGYDIALRYDPGNVWAAYLQGQIMLREQNFRRAQDAFAYALIHAPDEVSILKALAFASYFAQDLESATKAINRAAELAPDDPEIRYNRVLINAAAGRLDTAADSLAHFRNTVDAKASFRTAHLTTRLGDWRRFHGSKGYLKKAQLSTDDIFGSGGSAPADDPSSSDSASPSASSDSGSASSGSTTAQDKPAQPKMTLVDVVIIRSEERQATGKGVNLLSGLTATLGGTTFQYSDTRTINAGAANSRSRVFTYSPTLSVAASYSLNIFNDNFDRNEVLARPTLVALNGEQSQFFSGAVWHVELSGAAGSEGSLTDVPIGIKLTVTPTFQAGDFIKLSVEAERSFIEDRSSSAGFNNFSQTTKTTVAANVTLKFDETLVLSGLSERETEKVNDGVPFLQDLPGIQYLFSREDTLDFTKSVIILLTPRKPRYTYADGTDKMEPDVDVDANQPHLKELEGREGWFRPASNIDAVFYHLRDGSFFKEFRQGDLAVERWSQPDRIERMLVRSLQFLYF